MHPEIEKLIDIALADGQVTDKERNVILKKAAELGINTDEVEMILDGKLHQIEANKPKQKEKIGNIRTCPACGTSVKVMEIKCFQCNHEFTSEIDKSLNVLMAKIEKINIDNYDFDGDYYKKIATLINKSIVPSLANDLYEFGIKSVAEINSELHYWRDDSAAWKNKAEDCIMKLKMVELQNPKFIVLRSEIENSLEKKVLQIKKNKRNENLNIIWVFPLLYFIFSMIARLFGFHFWPF
jgi:hypothetical protein